MFRAANGNAERSGHLRIIHGNSRASRARTCGPEGLVADARGGAGREGLDADDDAEREDDTPHACRRGCVASAVNVITRDLRAGASVRTKHGGGQPELFAGARAAVSTARGTSTRIAYVDAGAEVDSAREEKEFL